jgi:pimeloyl-ACP methyl ester carboxylesterase
VAGVPVFGLVHSPLVGPSTWAPVARELQERGRRAAVPSLLGPRGEAPSDWRACVDAVCRCLAAFSEPVVLVGHSGGGMLLPVIADGLAQPVRGLIFVDSGVPASAGETAFVPPELLEEFGTLAVNGILPPWSSWFGEAAIRDEVPDEPLRQALVREMPNIPFSFLAQQIPSPPGWERVPCRYLLLSEGYRQSATEAQERGWQVEVLEGARHLHIAVAPDVVSDALLRLET